MSRSDGALATEGLLPPSVACGPPEPTALLRVPAPDGERLGVGVCGGPRSSAAHHDLEVGR